jgi:peptidoglycan/xylan/chitin deacetylase (PgdA/CDA1 family)
LPETTRASKSVKPATTVATSWDDGDPQDLKVAELLRERGLVGTFYFPFLGYDGRQTLTPDHLRSLAAEGFEIGGHGMSHNVLTPLRSKEIAREVGICKKRLEDILGEQVRMFSYPLGRYNGVVVQHLKDAGYLGARTNRMLGYKLDFSPYEMPTTLQAAPLKKADYCRNALRSASPGRVLTYFARVIRAPNWVELGKSLFDLALRDGGVWHLYGHSWQVEEMGLWDDLKEILDYVSGREGVLYVTNAAVLNFLPGRTPVPARALGSAGFPRARE